MEVNLKMHPSKHSLMIIVLNIISLVQELHTKMELLKKNGTLQEMARTMLNESNVEDYFWAEAINTSCYILNRVSIRKVLNKTLYELWKNIKPSISYFHIFVLLLHSEQ